MKNRDCGSEKKLMKGEKLACVVCILGRPSTAGDCREKVVKEKFQFSVDGGRVRIGTGSWTSLKIHKFSGDTLAGGGGCCLLQVFGEPPSTLRRSVRLYSCARIFVA